jgi:hypothetical protein
MENQGFESFKLPATIIIDATKTVNKSFPQTQ